MKLRLSLEGDLMRPPLMTLDVNNIVASQHGLLIKRQQQIQEKPCRVSCLRIYWELHRGDLHLHRQINIGFYFQPPKEYIS